MRHEYSVRGQFKGSCRMSSSHTLPTQSRLLRFVRRLRCSSILRHDSGPQTAGTLTLWLHALKSLGHVSLRALQTKFDDLYPWPSLFRRPSQSHRSQYSFSARFRWQFSQSHQRHHASRTPCPSSCSSHRLRNRRRAHLALASRGAQVEAKVRMGEKGVGSGTVGATRECGATPPRRKEMCSV